MLSELQQAPFVLLRERLLLAFLGLALALFGAGGGGDGDELPSWVAQSNSEDVSHRCVVGLGELESFSVLIPGSD